VAYDLAALQTAFYARGFDFLNDAGAGVTRTTQYLNSALQEVDSTALWPYLLTSTTGTAPLTISDLRRVQTIVDTTNGFSPLSPSDARSLVRMYGDLTTTGQPESFYFTSQTQLSVYPTNTTNTLKVTYFKVGTDLSGASDAPLMPDRFRPIIVELAAAKAFRESNLDQEAAVAMEEYGRLLGVMERELLDPQVSGPSYMLVTTPQNY
jgi:hypothetical protein